MACSLSVCIWSKLQSSRTQGFSAGRCSTWQCGCAAADGGVRLRVEAAAGVALLEAALQMSPLLHALVLLLDVAQDLLWKSEEKHSEILQ